MMMPIRCPPTLEPIAEDPPFSPGTHLALEAPETVYNLSDFGYDDATCDWAPFQLAMTTAFRMLTDEGVAVLRHVVEQLRTGRRSTDRIANFVRGGVYRSQFLRDLCGSSDVTAFVSDLAGAKVLPHTMPLYQGHVNLMPDDPNADVDQWHTDTVALDWVLLVTDPAVFKGGQFEYFKCTKERAANALMTGQAEGIERVSARIPAAGYAVLQQGNLVMHRARRVTSGHERTTLVHSYIPADAAWEDVSRLDDCKPVDPPEILYTEWARHKALRSQARLQTLIDELPFTEDRAQLVQALESAIFDVQTAIHDLRDSSPGRLVFYSGDALTDAQR